MVWPVLTTYERERTREIAFPLGGIGTGTVSLGGRGNLRDWEIMNRPSKGFAPDYGFFTLWTKTADHIIDTRILEGEIPYPFTGASGVPIITAGIPRFEDIIFKAAYPLCSIDYQDRSVPLKVRLESFNPLIPHDPEQSGLPVAMFRFILKNLSKKQIEASIAGSLQNFIGSDGVDKMKSTAKNEFRKGNGFSGLYFSALVDPENASQNGTIALVTDGDRVSCKTRWDRASWRNDLLEFWDDFSADGVVKDVAESPQNTTTGTLAASVTVPPGSSRSITFMLAWHFPNRTAKDCGWQTQTDDTIGFVGNYYTTRFSDAWQVAEKVYPDLAALEKGTVSFVEEFCASTLPQPVKEAALNNISTLRTQNCFRTADGRFYGFEGTSDKSGCCFGSCTHVWNYETTTAFLFPSLARSMREVELEYGTNDSGLNTFRTALPLRKLCTACKPYGAAADGQMGVIMKLYREWRLSGDKEFLNRLWPQAKKALSFAWVEGGWDGDRDGVMEGVQHNTYDVEFYGPNPMMTGWYLGALRCAEEMASAAGDGAFAGECRELYEKGRRWVDENLFNGDYYVQHIQPPRDRTKVPQGLVVGMGASAMDDPDFQVGNGCLVDQLAGQYMAHVVGIGHILDPGHVRTTAASIFRNNFRENFRNHFNVLRTFVINDEAGLLICSWPHGDRPKVPFPYFSEVMTGFEYQAAALMIYEGRVDEGLRVVEAIRARFDGRKRNPWNEPECGHHYARAMAAWSSLLALSGFQWDGTMNTIGFAPRVMRESFRVFWSSGLAWGRYEQTIKNGGLRAVLTVRGGHAEIDTLAIGVPGIKAGSAVAVLDRNALPVKTKIEGDTMALAFEKTARMVSGSRLDITIR
jgi:non-lysosomal glucosylceramidase